MTGEQHRVALSDSPSLYSCRASAAVVVICTKDRPEEVRRSATTASRCAPEKAVLVVDASDDEATRAVCDELRQAGFSGVLHHKARRPGLARQRNEAVEVCRALGASVVHFIDDDTEVATGYFQAIEERFEREPSVMGAGGVIVNQPVVNYVRVKRLFLLASDDRGSVLRSGRNVLGQYPGSGGDVEWLSGCSMSFRLAVFEQLAFDGEMTAYSMGEDYDFTFRLSRMHRIVVEPRAECIHHVTPTGRLTARAHARLRTEATHRWVCAHRAMGMSRAAFWWSAVGDCLLNGAYGVLRGESGARQAARGVIDGALAIAMTGAQQS